MPDLKSHPDTLGWLVKKCKLGQVRLAEHFRDSMQRVDGAPWGQYLDYLPETARPQHGIFGTAAALQVLAVANALEYEPQINNGLESLPLLTPLPDSGVSIGYRSHYESKGDLRATHKVAALVDVASTLSCCTECAAGQTLDSETATRALLDLRQRTGWPDHSGAPNTSLHATVVALYSLSALPYSPDIAKALEATLKVLRSKEFNDWAIATASILVLGLRQFGQHEAYGESIERASDLLADAERVISHWAKTAEPRNVKRTLEATEFASPKESTADQAPGNGEWGFLLYMPHIVAALAILASRDLYSKGSSRRFVIAVTKIVAKDVNERGSFVTGGRELVSTVEQLWSFRLLHRFELSSGHLYGKNFVAVFDDRVRASGLAERMAVLSLPSIAISSLVAQAFVEGGAWHIALGAITAGASSLSVRVLSRAFSSWL